MIAALSLALLGSAHAQAPAPAPVPASSSEVGTSKDFGIGASLGSPTAFTMKYWLDDQSGLALHAGVRVGSQVLRAHYERDFHQIGNWDFATLDLYWLAGVAVALRSNAKDSLVRYAPGVGGGVGVDMRFKEVPASVFIDGPAFFVYPSLVNAQDPDVYIPLVPGNLVWTAGGRWYF